MQLDTLLIHGGKTTDEYTGAVNTPIYQTSTYAQEALGVNKGYEYSRTKNPTRDGIESLIAELENAKFGFAFASGLAALACVLNLFKSGDEVIILSNVYGGTFRLLDKVFSRFNLKYKILNDAKDFQSQITPATKALLFETPTNPLLNVVNIAELCDIARKNGVLSIVDNTFMTPYLQRPLDLGADIVVHSATKYLGGHSDLIAGLVALNNQELAEQIGFLQNAIGSILAPFDSFLLIRGIKTLGIRMQKHSQNALEIARYLSTNEAILKVYYPFLENDENYTIQKTQAKSGGGMLSFELKPNYDYKVFFKSTKIIALAESLGGVESLLCHPASMTHASIPQAVREKLGISQSLIRLSVGIEDAQDLIFDLQQAIQQAKQ